MDGGRAETCEPGAHRPAGDNCNTCSCEGGHWECTFKACHPPPPPPQPIDAGSPRICGGKIGLQCADSEYCAYEEGQLCGAADASSTCRARPQACDTVFDPVCGCDQEGYANAGVAAMAGVGVMNKGACTAR